MGIALWSGKQDGRKAVLLAPYLNGAFDSARVVTDDPDWIAATCGYDHGGGRAAVVYQLLRMESGEVSDHLRIWQGGALGAPVRIDCGFENHALGGLTVLPAGRRLAAVMDLGGGRAEGKMVTVVEADGSLRRFVFPIGRFVFPIGRMVAVSSSSKYLIVFTDGAGLSYRFF